MVEAVVVVVSFSGVALPPAPTAGADGAPGP